MQEYNENCLFFRVQYHYCEHPEGANILGNDLYDEYVNSLKASSYDIEPTSKPQFSMIVSRIFKNVRVSAVHGYRVYKGLRRYDTEDKECEIDDIKIIGEKHDFICMNSKEILKYALSTGHCINGNEVLKIIEIDNDRSWKFMISGQEVEPDIIGLNNITANTVKQVNTIFNTVKQTTICRGKKVEKEKKSTQFRLLQEWSVNGSCSIERRVSSRKCKRILNFTARSSVCPTCMKSGEKGHHASGITEEKILSQLFPNASDETLNHLKEQSKICQLRKDPKGNRRERDTIRIALNLRNRSPQVS